MDIRALAASAATNAGIDPAWFQSLVGRGEGGFSNPNGVSPKGARGPAQLMPATAAEMGVRDINDPAQNLNGGARYARQMLDRFGDPTLATAAYNAGPGAVQKAGGVPNYPETQAYVQRVMGSGSELSQDQLASDFSASQAPQRGAASGSVRVASARPATPQELQGSPLTDDELTADFNKTQGPQGPSSQPPQLPQDGVINQVGRGALQGIAGTADAFTGFLKSHLNPVAAYDAAMGDVQPIANLIQTAFAPNGTPIPKTTDFAGSRAAMNAPGVASAAASPFTSVQPGNVQERVARAIGQFLPGAALGPEASAPALAQIAVRVANVAFPMMGQALGAAGAKALGLPEEAQQDFGNLGMVAGGGVANTRFEAPVGAPSPAPRVSPQVADLAKLAINKYGLDVRPSLIMAAEENANKVKNGPAAIADSEMVKKSGSGYAANNTKLLRGWNRSLSHEIGLDTPHLTQDAIHSAVDTIGGKFDAAGWKVGVAGQAIPDLIAKLDKIGADAGEMGMDQSQLNAVNAHIQKVKDAIKANGGKIPGDVYLNLTQSGSTLSRVSKNDSTAFGDSARDIKGALQDGVIASSSPEDVAALQQAKTQYKALKTIQPLTDKAGPLGYVTPALLQQRVIKSYGNGYSKGGAGNMGELADIGRLIGDLTSDSGSQARIVDAVKHSAGGFGGALGGAFLGGELLHEPMHAVAGAATGAAIGLARHGMDRVQGARSLSPALRAKIIGTAPGPSVPVFRPPAFFGAPLIKRPQP